MFTGIIEELGTIKRIQRSSQSGRLTIQAGITLDQTKIGDSIAVNGVCLTVTRFSRHTFEADVSPETLDKSTLGELNPGDRVNLERALRLSDRLNGHLVSGHIDGTGVIADKKTMGNAVVVAIRVPESMAKYMIKKGSVAIDGISLTINLCQDQLITLSVIPHTAELTTIGLKQKGGRVNIETDMIAKYVEQFLTHPRSVKSHSPGRGGDSVISTELLAKNGFL